MTIKSLFRRGKHAHDLFEQDEEFKIKQVVVMKLFNDFSLHDLQQMAGDENFESFF